MLVEVITSYAENGTPPSYVAFHSPVGASRHVPALLAPVVMVMAPGDSLTFTTTGGLWSIEVKVTETQDDARKERIATCQDFPCETE